MFYVIRGEQLAQRTITDLGRLGVAVHTGTRELLNAAVDEVIRPGISHQFIASGEPPWEELEASTVQRRQSAGFAGDAPLVRSGEGMAEATSRRPWTVTREAATYTEPEGYIRHHQAGGEDLPARPYVRLTDADARQLDAVGLQWLDGRIRGAGW